MEIARESCFQKLECANASKKEKKNITISKHSKQMTWRDISYTVVEVADMIFMIIIQVQMKFCERIKRKKNGNNVVRFLGENGNGGGISTKIEILRISILL